MSTNLCAPQNPVRIMGRSAHEAHFQNEEKNTFVVYPCIKRLSRGNVTIHHLQKAALAFILLGQLRELF